MNKKKVALYGGLAVITAPIWVPLTWATYLGLRLTTRAGKVAFKYPERTALGLTLAGMVTYASCNYKEEIQTFATETIPTITRYQKEVNTLEKYIEELNVENEESSILPIEGLYEPNTVFYYTKPGDTLIDISVEVSGLARNYRIIQEVNNIRDPHLLPAGTLLRLPKSICTRDSDQLYTQVPDLDSVVIKGTYTIQDAFPKTWRDVLEMNRSLGLDYSNSFPHKKRVVYYKEEIHNLNKHLIFSENDE